MENKMSKKTAQKTKTTNTVNKVVSTKKPINEWNSEQLLLVATNCEKEKKLVQAKKNTTKNINVSS